MAAWLAPLSQKLRLCLSGPAEKLFKEKLGEGITPIYTIDDALNGAQLLISGTGWSSNLEHKARVLARQRGIPSVAVLDHWTNYRQRFERQGEVVLSDNLWVADCQAAKLARATFADLPILQLPNHWLGNICDSVRLIRSAYANTQRTDKYKPGRRLLYLLEPIRVNWTSNPSLEHSTTQEAGEFQALRYWLQRLQDLIDLGWVAPRDEIEALVLRPHPSEAAGKYDFIIAQMNSKWPIQLDTASSLAEALAWADISFGCETQALVAAMACELPAFSTLPPWAPPCRLPHESLHHLSRLEGA